MRKLLQHQKTRDLISIRRNKIDANPIQGFVLASSEKLVALQYVYDFNLDGFMILRTEDITEVKCSSTDKFQKSLLEKEGLLSRVPFGTNFDLQNWQSAISQLSLAYPLMILECESGNEKDFAIGQVVKTTKVGAWIRHFSGVSNWSEEPERLKYKDITSCQVDTNYINVYQRHFERDAS